MLPPTNEPILSTKTTNFSESEKLSCTSWNIHDASIIVIKMANYQAEICHLLIKLNSNSFLQTHGEDKLSISVNHN